MERPLQTFSLIVAICAYAAVPGCFAYATPPDETNMLGYVLPTSWLEDRGFLGEAETADELWAAWAGKSSNGCSLRECWMAGLDPNDPKDRFAANISVVDGSPVIGWNHDLGGERIYAVEGKTNLTDAAWCSETNSAHRFFRVTVDAPRTVVDRSGRLAAGSFVSTESVTLQYWLYTPEAADSEAPLILYLHGGSDKGTTLAHLLTHGFPKFLADGELGDVPAYVLMPLLVSDYTGWAEIKVTLRDAIARIRRTCAIDAARISVAGHSMGGKGTWDLAMAYPNLFSCAVPLCGGVNASSGNIQKISGLPVWAFVGSEDEIVRPESSQTFVKGLQNLGNAEAFVTTFAGATHGDVPKLAFLKTDIIGWMIGRRKW